MTPSNALCTPEKPRCREATSPFADYEGCYQRVTSGRIFFYQALETHSDLLDRIGRFEIKGLCKCMVCDGLCRSCDLTKMIRYAS